MARARDRTASAAAACARARRQTVRRQSAVPARPVARGDRVRRRRRPAGFRGSRGDGAHRCADAGRPGARAPGGGVRLDVPPPDAGMARRRRTIARPGRRRPGSDCSEFFDEEDGRLSALSPFAAARCGVRGSALQAAPAPARRGRGAARRGSGRSGGRRPASCRCITSKRGEYAPRGATRRSPRRRAEEVYAYVEAAGLYSRALERRTSACPISATRARGRPRVARRLLVSRGRVREGLRRLCRSAQAASAAIRCAGLGLLLKRSKLEEKLGKYPQALRWAARARKAVSGTQRGRRGPAGGARRARGTPRSCKPKGRTARRDPVGASGRSAKPRPPTIPKRSVPPAS